MNKRFFTCILTMLLSARKEPLVLLFLKDTMTLRILSIILLPQRLPLWCLLICLLASVNFVDAQINLAPNSIYDSPPVLTNGEYLATDYNVVTKSLVLESFSTNALVGVSSASVYGPAAGRDSVFFGGDQPNGLGAIAAPVFTTSIFSKSDFPISLKCNFYSRQDVAMYNEQYFAIVPADYKYFSSPTYYVNGESDQKEGIIIGGRPYQSWISNNHSSSQASVKLNNSSHNVATNGSWFTMEVLLDLRGNDLYVEYLKVNNESVFSSAYNLGALPYLDAFRLGIAVDDMAHGFQVKKRNKDPIVAEFSSALEICEGECLDFIDESEVPASVDKVTYSWLFEGSETLSSTASNPNSICYENEGVYPVRLIISDGFQKDTFVQNVLVKPLPKIDLGGDTTACKLGYPLRAEYPMADYLWSDGSSESTLWIADVGEYWVNLSLDGCEYRDTVVVDSIVRQDISLGPDQSLCTGEEFVLGSDVSSGWTYKWNSSSVDSREIRVTSSGSYWLEASDGCWIYRDTASISFGECADFKFYFPNAFSPNVDDINPTLKPVILEGACCTVRDYSLEVYNRWGELVFVSEDINRGWDGSYLKKNAQMGVYLCILRYKHGLKSETVNQLIHLLR